MSVCHYGTLLACHPGMSVCHPIRYGTPLGAISPLEGVGGVGRFWTQKPKAGPGPRNSGPRRPVMTIFEGFRTIFKTFEHFLLAC